MKGSEKLAIFETPSTGVNSSLTKVKPWACGTANIDQKVKLKQAILKLTALFDNLLACAIQSSHAMDATVKALAPDPLHAYKLSF